LRVFSFLFLVLFGRQIQAIVGQTQIFNGRTTNVGGRQFPKAFSRLRRANDLLQRQIHVGVRDGQATVVRFTAFEFHENGRALGGSN